MIRYFAERDLIGSGVGLYPHELKETHLWPSGVLPDLCAFTPVLQQLRQSMSSFVNNGVEGVGSPFVWTGVGIRARLTLRRDYKKFVTTG